MGVMSRPAPWWLTWLVAGGLLVLFLSERILTDSGYARAVVSGLGALVVLGGTAWRFASWRVTTGEAKRVETLFLLGYAGCIVAVAGFVVSSADGMQWLGIAFDDRGAERRYEVTLQVLSAIVLVASAFPILGAQWALAAHRHAGQSALHVESQRVRETAAAALTVALAGSALMLAGYVATDRDKTLDLSYFKTASPGTGAEEMTRNLPEPLRVLLFFPEVNAVKDELAGYFRSLADATGNVIIEEHDRMVSPNLAREYRVTSDGAIVLLRGDRSELILFSPDIRLVRPRLRKLDGEIQERLWRLAREQRVAYITVGHGELNDPLAPADSEEETADPLQTVDLLEDGLRALNYRVETLGLQQGLGQSVPDDATMVFVMGPTTAFLPEELDALDRYLAAGGAIFFALNPDSEFRLGPLERRFGVRPEPVQLANDRQYVRRRGNVSDRQLIITDQFSAHEAVTSLSRTRVGSGILLLGAGHLERTEDRGPRPRFVIRSMPTTFADLDGDYEFDSSTEVRKTYNLAAAIEGTDSVPAPDGEGEARRMRALIYADAEMFSDGVLRNVALNGALLADAIRWLGGEESFAGDVVSEEDVPIVHTRAQDVAWFYSTILGAPLLILAAGLVTVVRRRSGRAAR